MVVAFTQKQGSTLWASYCDWPKFVRYVAPFPPHLLSFRYYNLEKCESILWFVITIFSGKQTQILSFLAGTRYLCSNLYTPARKNKKTTSLDDLLGFLVDTVSGGAGPPLLNYVSRSPQMSISFEFPNGSGFPNDCIEPITRPVSRVQTCRLWTRFWISTCTTRTSANTSELKLNVPRKSRQAS